MQEFLGKITVGIDDGDAIAPMDVLDNEVAKQGRFSGTRLPDNVAMMTGIQWLEAERHAALVIRAIADDEWVICNHGVRASPHSVATNGLVTGRRFLCGETPGKRCVNERGG